MFISEGFTPRGGRGGDRVSFSPIPVLNEFIHEKFPLLGLTRCKQRWLRNSTRRGRLQSKFDAILSPFIDFDELEHQLMIISRSSFRVALAEVVEEIAVDLEAVRKIKQFKVSK